jgi:ATP-dependent RNA helicase DeaD
MLPQTLDPALAKALADRGYATLTPVQQAVVEPHVADRDLLVSAKTGSGKTVAYGLVLAQTLLGVDGSMAPAGAPSALVIAPTRELAMQVQRELQWLYANARVVSCVGGMDPRAERRALEQGCHIVVGTPGRLRDHLERGQLRLSELGVAVIDEADEMLDLGFKEELEEILDASPKDRRTLLFSATLPKPIVTLAATYQNNALRLVVGAGEEAHSDIEYRAIRISPSEVELATVNVLRFFESGAAIVFCATRDGVRKLHASLVERGFSAVALSGELTQNERTHALQALRDRRARVCVATDVAARGIDIPDLDLVIHADLPNNRDTLQHRSGRTGRAGRKGTCVILVPHPKRRRLDILLKAARIEAIWQPAPTAEDIRAQDQARLIEDVKPAAEAAEDDLAAARELMEKRTAEDIAAAYIRLARTRMPAPEDLSDSGPEPQSYGGGHERGERGGSYEPRIEAPRAGFEDAVWFRIDFGRNKNAEARWILPMICRRGHVTKNEIGAIRIFERETRFQIAGAVVEQFETVAAKGGGDGGNIERLGDDAPPPPRDRNMSSSRHRALADEAEAPRAPRTKPNYADRKKKRDDQPTRSQPVTEGKGGERAARNDDFLRDEFKAPDFRKAAASQAETSEGFKRPPFRKKDGFQTPDLQREGPRKEGFKRPDFKKPAFKQDRFKAGAGGGGDRAAWTPPLDGDGPAPAKPKKSKKRKANG